jgi:hypothetical protein
MANSKNGAAPCVSPISIAPIGSASSGGTRQPGFGELLIDCEEVRILRAVLVGRLRKTRGGRGEGGRVPVACGDGVEVSSRVTADTAHGHPSA